MSPFPPERWFDKNHSPRIAFVGKASWNSKEDIKDDTLINNFIDLSYVGRGYLEDTSNPPFWNFINKITKEINLTSMISP